MTYTEHERVTAQQEARKMLDTLATIREDIQQAKDKRLAATLELERLWSDYLTQEGQIIEALNIRETAAREALEAQLDRERKAALDTVLSQATEYHIQKSELERSYKDHLADLHMQESALSDQIRIQAEVAGETVKGKTLMAVYTPGKLKLTNMAGLAGYALAVPAVLKFCQEGDPVISIRERR